MFKMKSVALAVVLVLGVLGKNYLKAHSMGVLLQSPLIFDSGGLSGRL